MASQTNDVKQIFLTLEQWRVSHEYNQKTIASMLGIAPSTYTKYLNGDIADMKLSVLNRICEVTGLMPFQLMRNFSSQQNTLMDLITKLPASSIQILSNVAEFEYNFYMEHDDERDYITLFEPNGFVNDGMLYESARMSKVFAKKYKDIYGSKLFGGLKISTNIFHPIYSKDDVLLISSEPPRHRQIGVFYNKKDKCIYLRQYFESNPDFPYSILEPVIEHPGCKRIYINTNDKDDLAQWKMLGYIIGKMR